MASIVLCEADRARLGCPERLPIDPVSVTVREAITLKRFGYATPFAWRLALSPEGAGVADAVDGVLAIEGLPDRAVAALGQIRDAVAVLDHERGERDHLAWLLLVWLALRRADIDTDPETLDFCLDQIRVVPDRGDPEDEGESGKAETVERPPSGTEEPSSTSAAT